MRDDSFILLGLFIGFIGLTVTIVNAVYFHFRYQKKIDQAIAGGEDDIGFLLGLTRLTMYGHYCLFSRRAKKAGVYDIFSRLPAIQRAHLIFHWFSLLFFSFLAFGSSALID